jgi:hypothetical protein
MPWPKGRPRPKKTPIETQQQPSGEKSSKRWKMHNGDWDDDFHQYAETPDLRDRFSIPEELRPEGYDLQWVTCSVLGQTMQQFRTHAHEAGWRAVYQSDFDNLFDGRWMARGAPGEICVDGMVLCARPIQISRLARQRENRNAEAAVGNLRRKHAMDGLPVSGGFEARGKNFHRSEYERIEVPSGRRGD